MHPFVRVTSRPILDLVSRIFESPILTASESYNEIITLVSIKCVINQVADKFV
jgi:hypothetical protein